jgi:hypothetical protein
MKEHFVSIGSSFRRFAGGLSAARAADMSFERALNADREPRTGSCITRRIRATGFPRSEIDTASANNLRQVFTIGLGRLQPVAVTPRAISKPRHCWITA